MPTASSTNFAGLVSSRRLTCEAVTTNFACTQLTATRRRFGPGTRVSDPELAHFAACKTTIIAEQTAELFLTNIVRLHGIPSAIISDRGPRFTSNFWTKTWQQYGSRLHLSTVYHPQSDGQTERTNQMMEKLIRTACTDPAQWEDALPLIEFAYNNAPSATTTQSPFFLNYGIDPTTPLSPLIENPARRSQRLVENL
ncbi:hypothetical protein CLOM_g14477 [Closterium sp. NIES-68]|nr:hypothetical protein CLOM_g14477 [Closterium sp. NIES-68]